MENPTPQPYEAPPLAEVAPQPAAAQVVPTAEAPSVPAAVEVSALPPKTETVSQAAVAKTVESLPTSAPDPAALDHVLDGAYHDTSDAGLEAFRASI